jgi:RND family efflux transporter MFP subunit
MSPTNQFNELSIMRLLGIAIAASLVIAGCGGKSPEQKGPPPIPVSVYQASRGSATFYDEYPATVTALNQVDIRAEVSGYITYIFFQEGKHIAKGARLFAIDQRQFKAAYDQAAANLNVSRANLAKVRQDVERYEELAKEDAVARQTLEHARADLQSATMQVAAAEANVNSAETNVRYAVIYSPFDCTVGISQVKVGSSVTAGQTLLTTVSSDNPIAVDAAVDEKQIPRFSELLKSLSADDESRFTIKLPNHELYLFPGQLTFMDRAVDPQTGTIRIRVTFPNTTGLLRPGLTCNLRVKADNADSTLLIPYKCVTELMGEYFVYVVSDGKASQRRVTLGMRAADKISVTDGLKEGDNVVTEGVQKLRDNSPVVIPAEAAKAGQQTAK